MAGKEVIRAVQWFTKDGASKKVSAAKEITIGATLGMVTGLIWQVSRVEARALGRGMSRLVEVGGLAWFGEEKKRVCVSGDAYYVQSIVCAWVYKRSVGSRWTVCAACEKEETFSLCMYADVPLERECEMGSFLQGAGRQAIVRGFSSFGFITASTCNFQLSVSSKH